MRVDAQGNGSRPSTQYLEPGNNIDIWWMRYIVNIHKTMKFDKGQISPEGRWRQGHTGVNNIYNNIPCTVERPIPKTRNKGGENGLNKI